MNPRRIATFLSLSRSIADPDRTRPRLALPTGQRPGRFATCAADVRAAAIDPERAAAVERVGLPRRYARAILF